MTLVVTPPDDLDVALLDAARDWPPGRRWFFAGGMQACSAGWRSRWLNWRVRCWRARWFADRDFVLEVSGSYGRGQDGGDDFGEAARWRSTAT